MLPIILAILPNFKVKNLPILSPKKVKIKLVMRKRIITDEEMEEIMKKEILPLRFHIVNPFVKEVK